VFGARLVDFVDDHHRVRVGTVDQRFEDLPGRAPFHWLDAPDSTQPAVRLLMLMKPIPVPSRWATSRAKWVFPMPGGPSSSIGVILQRVAAVVAQGELAAHVVENAGEVGHLVVEVVHRRQAAGFDLETLGAAFEHALVGGAQRLVFALRQLVQALSTSPTRYTGRICAIGRL